MKQISKTKMILVAAILLLILVRVAAPPLILRHLNDSLAHFSETYELHIGDLDFALWRGAYRFEDLEAKLKKDGHVFAKAEAIDVSVNWNSLLHGSVLMDVLASDVQVLLSQTLLESSQASQAHPQDDAEKAADKLFPVQVARITVRNSGLEITELLGDSLAERWRVTGVEGWVTNFTATPQLPLTQFALRGTLMETSILKMAGEMKRLDDPKSWNIDFEGKNFQLPKANVWLKKYIPLTFTAGDLDLYAEVKSEKGKISGYAKPFFKKAKILYSKDDFVGVKHFFVEILTAAVNVILRKSDDHSVAAEIPFSTENGKLKVGTAAAISSAIGHGFGDPLAPKMENTVRLKDE